MSQHNVGASPSAPIDEGSHISIIDLLPEYVTILVLGQQLPAEWAPLERHLQQCKACQAEAESLKGQLAEVYSPSLPVPYSPEPPPPDLSFLRRARSARPRSRQPARPAVQTAALPSPGITLQFSTALLAHMQVRMNARSGGLHLRHAYTFPVLRETDPTITVEVLSSDEQSNLGVVRICVEDPRQDPFEQAGSLVRLHIGETSISAVTNQSGIVFFHNVALDAIETWQISVEPADAPQREQS